jgi:hypothetical protein
MGVFRPADGDSEPLQTPAHVTRWLRSKTDLHCMNVHQILAVELRIALIVASIMACPAMTLGQAQVPSADVASSDDLSVADGLQLPIYGHAWALDTWKGVAELVPLHQSESASEHSFSLTARHAIVLKGEAASVRIHKDPPQIFMRGVSGNDDTTTRSDFVLVRLNTFGERREATKAASDEVAAAGKRKATKLQSADVIELQQQRVAVTDWYKLSPKTSLEPGEYALVPLPNTPAAALGELYDFAIDLQAPENHQVLRSEKDRRVE